MNTFNFRFPSASVLTFGSALAVAMIPALAGADSNAATNQLAGATRRQAQAPAQAPGQAPGQVPNDAQIAQIVMTVNQGEIDQAKYVRERTQNKQVQQFAEHMLKAHRSSNEEAAALAKDTKLKPEDSALSETMEDKDKRSLEALRDKKGAELDAAYIQAQVNTHQEVLTNIDKNLIPGARNTELKAMLKKTRKEVASHLEHAKRVQGALQAPASG